MTTAAVPPPRPGEVRALRLWDLMKRPLTDKDGEAIGRLSDVIVRWRGADLPLVTGLVAAVAGREVYVPVEQASAADPAVLRLTSNAIDLRKFERRHGEVLLRADVLGHRLIDVDSARLVKAVDLELEQRNGDWVLAGVDTRRRPRRIFGGRGGAAQGTGAQPFRDWARFEPLIGHVGSAVMRGPFARIRRLKPAQIADLLEEASKAEESEILGQVHADPELEADVFEELDEDLATRLLGARTDADIAAVLARMRADDAADAVAELPQSRRQPVLDLLPAGQRTKVLTLMGFNPASAGGLMSVDFVAVPLGARAGEALAAVASASALEPEALTSVHVTSRPRSPTSTTMTPCASAPALTWRMSRC
jgi:MgtE intracellular N domain